MSAVKTIEEMLEDAKKLIGAETKPVQCRYPIEFEPIRRFCHMNLDTNKLFLDPEYAKGTKYGNVICPPLYLGLFPTQDPWPPDEDVPALPIVPTPGNRAINLSTEWEFFRPVKVGERLWVKRRIADVYMRAIRLDPKAFWIVTETIISDQGGEVVATCRNLLLRHRSPEQIKAGE